MFDVWLNAAKLALSEDARKSVSAIVDLIQRSSEWQRDICRLQAKIESSHQEHAALLAGLAATKLRNLQYSNEAIEAFRASYLELTNNAFQHGSGVGQSIGVVIEVSAEYVSATIENSRGRDFDFLRLLDIRRAELAANPRTKRGRGLLFVFELSDSLEHVKPRALKAVFYRSRVEFETLRFRDLMIIRLNDGMQNPSLSRRVVSLVSNALSNSDVVLDLSEYASYAGTVLVTVVLQLTELGMRVGHSFVVIVAPPRDRSVSFFRAAGPTVTTSWKDALAQLERSSYEPDLAREVRTRARLVYDSGWHRSKRP